LKNRALSEISVDAYVLEASLHSKARHASIPDGVQNREVLLYVELNMFYRVSTPLTATDQSKLNGLIMLKRVFKT
jgi:hypothetical protein